MERDIELGVPIPMALEEVARRVGEALAVRLEARENSSYGDYFGGYTERTRLERIWIYENFDPEERAPHRETEPHSHVVVRIDSTEQEPDELVESVRAALKVDLIVIQCHEWT